MIGNTNLSTLNSLIETTVDSVDNYRTASQNAHDSNCASMLSNCANERAQIVSDLQAKVRDLGGEPEDDGTELAAARRAFLGMRAAVTGKHDDDAIIAEVERSEDHIKAKYERALKEEGLDPSVRSCIEQAYRSVREGHDKMSMLKHSLNAH